MQRHWTTAYLFVPQMVTLAGIQSLLESGFCMEKQKYIFFFLEKQVAVYILFLLAETKQD